jgi:CDP-diacylglycerol---serine O-phosphatidyltransferase
MDMRLRPRPALPIASLLPNALTLAALCAGLTAVRFAVQARFDLAVGLILLAAVLDGLDGRLARRFGSESAIGAELDSLCDFVNFGVAPALVMYLWAFGGVGGDGWIAALVYAVACVLRLARFNIGSRDPLAATQPKKSFTGVPSPAGAMLVMLPIYLAHLGAAALVLPTWLSALWMIAVAALMVSRWPTPAFRPVSIRPDLARVLLLALVGLGAALLTHPWLTLVLLNLGYVGLLIWNWARPKRRRERTEG